MMLYKLTFMMHYNLRRLF